MPFDTSLPSTIALYESVAPDNSVPSQRIEGICQLTDASDAPGMNAISPTCAIRGAVMLSTMVSSVTKKVYCGLVPVSVSLTASPGSGRMAYSPELTS